MLSPAPESNDPLDVDLPCPGNETAAGCGYNLRRLPGDPVRCPECGAQYARASVRMAVLEHNLRGFADPPAGTAILAWVTLRQLAARDDGIGGG